MKQIEPKLLPELSYNDCYFNILTAKLFNSLFFINQNTNLICFLFVFNTN